MSKARIGFRKRRAKLRLRSRGRAAFAPPATVVAACLVTIAVALASGTAHAGWVLRHEPEPPPYPWGPEILPTDHRVYRDIERLAIRGELPITAWTLRPLSRTEIVWMSRSINPHAPTQSTHRFYRDLAWELDGFGLPNPYTETPPAFEAISGSNRLRIRPYAQASPRLTFTGGRETSWDWSDSTRAGLTGALYLGRNVVASADFFVGEVKRARRFADPIVAGTDVVILSERFDVSVRTALADIRIGRDRQHWGPGAWGNLILDHTSAPYTYGGYDVPLGPWFRFRAMTAVLNLDQGLYAAAHRFIWTPSDRLELSFTEGARFQSDQPSLLYAMGFIPYTLVERLQAQDALTDSTGFTRRNNLMVSFGWTWRVTRDQVFYGELLADDIPTKEGTSPTRLGFLGGYTAAPRFGGWDWTLGLEAAKVYNYVYSVHYRDVCLCDWQHQERGLGFPDGPDSERLLVRALVDVTPSWGGDLIVTGFRHGQGAIGRPWYPAGFPESEGLPREAWVLWGPVRYGVDVRTVVRWEPRDNVGAAVGLTVGTRDVTRDAETAEDFLRLDWQLHVSL